MRSAQSGDIFVLLTPSPTLSSSDFPWQLAWQARYGGTITDPLHVSLQRFICPDEEQLGEVIRALQAATTRCTPLPLVGVDVRPLYSAFREKYILKCRTERTSALQSLDDLINTLLETHGLTPHYRKLAVLITVLEAIAKPVSMSPQPLPMPQPLFIGCQLVVSRVTGQERYDMIAQWDMHG
ncbi:MAG: hypothetical protein R2867_36625 [Caldilineaceae bacterium]